MQAPKRRSYSAFSTTTGTLRLTGGADQLSVPTASQAGQAGNQTAFTVRQALHCQPGSGSATAAWRNALRMAIRPSSLSGFSVSAMSANSSHSRRWFSPVDFAA